MKIRTEYQCSSCGAKSPLWKGQCPACRSWNTLAAVDQIPAAGRGRRGEDLPARETVRLEDPILESGGGTSTGDPGLDELLGGGLVPGSAVLFAGEPGIGKSTLLLQLCALAAKQGVRSVYVSGEESLGQLRSRAERLGILGPGLEALCTGQAEEVYQLLEKDKPPGLVVVDSVQTLVSAAAEGIPGSVSQVRAVASALIDAVKRSRAALILVGHVTKEGQIAGPKLLEHMVDTVLSLEGDKQHLFRILRVIKNRFGPAGEVLVLQMTSTGLSIVHDPSTYFLEDRDAASSGTALAMAVDGQRPFVVEVQALATESYLAMPRRTALGFDSNRLNLLLAVMSRQLRVNLGQLDIYAKIGGGLRLHDPGIDLAIVAAVLSSVHDRPLPQRSVFWGEVDLNGRVRPVFGEDVRRRQSDKLGYTAYSKNSGSDQGLMGIAELKPILFG